jgi:glycosyltransferase involved in cell wall biosynthesis
MTVQPRRVLHIISGLGAGGAEMMLSKLLSRADARRFSHEVVSLSTLGTVGDRLTALGHRVRALGMSAGTPNPLLALKLALWVGSAQAALVQTWMYHGDLLGGLMARTLGVPVVWGIHMSYLDPALFKRRTQTVQRACAFLSRSLPSGVICCSEASRRAHVDAGYDASSMVVIPNGFDLEGFAPDAEARVAVRAELGIGDDVPLVGLVARYDPAKDHANFFRAAARVRPDAHFVLCGQGVDHRNHEIVRMCSEAGVAGRVHLLGRREDVPRIDAALDIACCSSSTEGFPNAIGEAMACGVPCVVTDCGDLADMVGETGRVVPPRDPAALAGAIESLLALSPADRRAIGHSARRRVAYHYELGRIVRRYEDYYDNILGFAHA